MDAIADPVAEVLGIQASGPLPLMSAIEHGLPLSAMDRVVRSVAPTDNKFAFRIIPRATLARRRKVWASTTNRTEGRLSAEEGTRLARLAGVWALALEVWGSTEAAREFMFAAHPLLHGRRPVDIVLENELGRPVVEGILGRLQYRIRGVTAQTLDRILTAYRIGDPAGAYPIFDASGSKRFPGRWNTGVSPMIYTSETYGLAMLEKLVYGNGHLPPNQHWIAITIPPGVSSEMFSTADHPGWEAENCRVAKAFGEAWQKSGRSLLLIVPSVVARMERNVLINDCHEDLRRITGSLYQPVWWDRRLFPTSPVPPTGGSATRRRKP